jgi:hypothetical protein
MIENLSHKSPKRSLNAFSIHFICQDWAFAISDSLEYWSTGWRTGHSWQSKAMIMIWENQTFENLQPVFFNSMEHIN